jgi:hypothetical protein
MTGMTSDVSQIQLGACIATFANNDLGLTKGGVEVTLSTTTYKITVDQFGGTNVNEYITGREASAKVPLAETSLDRLQIAFPGSVIVTDATTPTKKKLSGATGVGISLRSLADVLTLHPKPLALADKSQDFTLPIASPKGDLTFSYKHDEERVYSIEFMGYPDLTTGILFVIGDATANA